MGTSSSPTHDAPMPADTCRSVGTQPTRSAPPDFRSATADTHLELMSLGASTPAAVPGANPAGSVWSAVTTAWSAVALAWRVAAVSTAIVALAATRSPAVPVGSGLAVAVIVVAAVVDVHCRRLPNRILLYAGATLAASTAVELARSAPVAAVDLVIGALVMSGPLLAMHLLSPGAMGRGDVKAAVVLGAAVGAVDWQLSLSALALAAGATATVGLVARVRSVPFGPGLVAASAVALAAHRVLLPAAGEEPGTTQPTAALAVSASVSAIHAEGVSR